MGETVWVVLVAALLSAGGVTTLAWRVARTEPSQPDRLVGQLLLARWAGLLLAGVGGIAIGLAAARAELPTAHLDAALGVIFVGLGAFVLQREPRDALLAATGAFVLHALMNIAHRPGWLSVDVAPYWYTVGCAVYDVYMAGLCFWARRR